MSLPDSERTDLLEYLGATRVPTSQIDRLIVRVSEETKRCHRVTELADAE